MTFPEFSAYDGLGLAQLVRSRQISPRELVQAAIERIEALNPKLNAVVSTAFERALETAQGPLPRGQFVGVPFLLKDLLSWSEGEPLSNGSRFFAGWRPPSDSEIVRRYRRAGVVVLGRTNTPEFGLLPFCEPELYGPARNPWSLDRTTGGSSGGSAAAVASGMVPLAGGGDGGGSLRIPASCCGVFGLKPTRARTPTGPYYGELWRGAVVEHVLARSVRDSAAMLDAIAGPDAGAPYYPPPPARPFLEETSLPVGRLQVAFTTDPLLGSRVHSDCRRAVLETAALLEQLGHAVLEDKPSFDPELFELSFLTMVLCETAADLREAERLLGRRVRRRDLEATTWSMVVMGRTVSAEEYGLAVRTLQRIARQVAVFFERHDVLLTPTLPVPPVPLGSLQPSAGERLALELLGALRVGRLLRSLGTLTQSARRVFEWMSFTPLANVTGQPAMSVPLARSADGLPIGVQFIGRYGDEATLFRLAAQLERAVPWADTHPTIWS
jgi:amidase